MYCATNDYNAYIAIILECSLCFHFVTCVKKITAYFFTGTGPFFSGPCVYDCCDLLTTSVPFTVCIICCFMHTYWHTVRLHATDKNYLGSIIICITQCRCMNVNMHVHSFSFFAHAFSSSFFLLLSTL